LRANSTPIARQCQRKKQRLSRSFQNRNVLEFSKQEWFKWGDR
jgi:hypothetical protein